MSGFFKDNPPATQVGSEDATESTIQEDAVTQTDTSGGFYQGSPDQTTTDAYTADALASKNAAEAAKVAAEAAQAASESAKTAAETAETNAETAETNAETAETNAETAETNAAASESAAATSAAQSASSASQSSSSASSASASETAAASSATSASNSSNTSTAKAGEAAASAANAATSESNAATSESNASTSAATSTTQATNSAASAASSLTAKNASEAAQVAAETAESNAASSATSAASSATSASGSATTATTQAGNASTSASNAATSATSSAASASSASAAKDAALAALDNFDDRYLGQKASDPSVDNDGNALITGALYFDTTNDVMRVYDGSQWLAAYADVSGSALTVNNLSDLANAATARTNLGLGTAATTAASDYATAAQADQTVSLTGSGATNVSGTYPNFTITSTDTNTDTNTTYTAGSGITLTGTTFSNAAPDQTVSLTGSGATSVSGTYPNFTITSTDTNTDTNTTYTAGSGITLTGTVFSNSAPDQTVALTGSGGTTVSGTYPNFTISSAASIDGTTINPSAVQIGGTTVIDSSRNLTNIGTLTANYGAVWSETVQGTATGTIHLDPDSNTDHAGSAITFGASDASAGANAQAGIYTRSDGGYGTKLYFSTTDSYASGSKTALSIDSAGNTSITRGALQIGGNGVWHAGNDGSGSGLDADLLDGSHKVDIQKQLVNVQSVTAADSCLPSTGYGFKHFLGLGPSNNDGHILGMTWSGTTAYGAQIYVDTDPNNIMAFRSRSSTGVWTSWNTVWHTGNDGSGSGLDADLLDGQQGSYYNQSQFTGSSFISRNISNPIAIDSVTTNMVGYVTGSSAAGYADGAGFSAAYNSSWVGQLFVDFRTGKLSTRGKNNGTWQAHRFMWDNLNDGSGSGLDADLLDGVQASGFLRTDGSNTGTYIDLYRDVTSSVGGYIDFREGSAQDIRLGVNVFDGELPQAGTALVVDRINSGGGDAHLVVHGEIFAAHGGTPSSGSKVWHAGNDGSGSGLDADLLDGQQASAFEPADATILHRGGDITSHNWNDFIDGTEASWNTVLNHTGSNRPSGAYNYGTALSFSKAGQAKLQIYAPETASNGGASGGLWYRTGWNTGYNAWQRIWDSANDGSGSGLDADTVDGIQGSTLREGSYSTNYYVNALYHDDWVRNHTNTNGHYWSTTGWHLYPKDADDFYLRAGSGSCGLALTVGNATARGYVYANTSNQIGFLNSSRNWSFKVDNSGNATATGNVTAYSDRRLKSDIEPLTNSLNTVCQLQGVKYKRNSTGATEIGFVAQDVKKVVPELVDIIDSRTENSDGVSDGIEDLHVMKYQNTVALLVESIKELKAEVDDLKEQLRTK